MDIQEDRVDAGETWLRMKRRRILDVASHLFLTLGYEGTTMKAIARGADCSVGYLYKHFAGKQDLLDELGLSHLEVYRSIRTMVRGVEGLKGLDCLKRELELMCEYLVDHRALIPIYAERESSHSVRMVKKMTTFRGEDIALLDEARTTGTIPDVDPALLYATIDGAIWAAMKAVAPTQRRETFLGIPDMIDELIFEPLRRRAPAGAGKELQS